MNRTKYKRKSDPTLNVKKIKASINELRWLDKHEEDGLPPVYSPKIDPRVSISKTQIYFEQPLNEGKSKSCIDVGTDFRETADEPQMIKTNLEVLENHTNSFGDESSKAYSYYLSKNLTSVCSSTQYGEVCIHMPQYEHRAEVWIPFEVPFAQDKYAIVVTSHHADWYITIKNKWKHAVSVIVTQLNACEKTAGSFSWIAVGELANDAS
jgi:hypothetical protein